MGDPSPPCEALTVLSRAFRRRSTGFLWLGSGTEALSVVLRKGEVAAVRPLTGAWVPAEPTPGPDGSVRLKLERVLAQVGLGASALLRGSRPGAPDPRERLVELLAGGGEARFEAADPVLGEDERSVGPTELLLLDAVARLGDDGLLGGLLGELDRPLVPPPNPREDRTLTVAEASILSHVDGVAAARDVLARVPVANAEGRRALAGLLLTGRVDSGPRPVSKDAPRPTIAPRAEGGETSAPRPSPQARASPEARLAPRAKPPPEAKPSPEAGRSPEVKRSPEARVAPKAKPSPGPKPSPEARPSPVPKAASAPAAKPSPAPGPTPADRPPAGAAPAAEATAAQRTRRLEILGLLARLPGLNHFEVLGLEPGCSTTDVKRAHTTLTRRYHPDSHPGDDQAEVHDAAEAILIRVGEAWEALSDPGSRAAYERRLRRHPRARPRAERHPEEDAHPADRPGSVALIADEGTLTEAEELLAATRYWDAIQLLESAMPRIGPRWQQHRARILLARAYAGNPKWRHRAEEILQDLVRDAPRSAEAHYQLGRLYKAGGLTARARTMFRRAVELKPGHRHAAAELGLSREAPGFLRRLFGMGRDRT